MLQKLIENPTQSGKSIADELGIYRQKVWREQTRLEKDEVIWGYTAVVDDSKLNHTCYTVLIKTVHLEAEFVEEFLNTFKTIGTRRETFNIRLINSLYTNGDYDWLIMFSAPSNHEAKRYVEWIRSHYKQYITERPVILETVIPAIREGKTNPHIETFRMLLPAAYPPEDNDGMQSQPLTNFLNKPSVQLKQD